MRIQIRLSGMKLTKTQRRRLEDRVGLGLARFGNRIAEVVLRLSDNKELPGMTSCQLGVNLMLSRMSVDHSDKDMFAAVDHVTNRMARTVARAIERQSW
jgi:ribosome-associated translation inhibitor RaiA